MGELVLTDLGGDLIVEDTVVGKESEDINATLSRTLAEEEVPISCPGRPQEPLPGHTSLHIPMVVVRDVILRHRRSVVHYVTRNRVELEAGDWLIRKILPTGL